MVFWFFLPFFAFGFYINFQVKVPTYGYVGIGISTNKRDAATNAARDFINFLIREGRVDPSSLSLSGNSGGDNFGSRGDPGLVRNDSGCVTGVGIGTSNYGSASGYGPMIRGYGPNYRPPPPPSQDRRHNPGFINIKETFNQDYIDRVAQKRKFEEAEELDVNSSIHGNWTLDNCKQQLHVFAQANKLKLDYKYNPVGPAHNR